MCQFFTISPDRRFTIGSSVVHFLSSPGADREQPLQAYIEKLLTQDSISLDAIAKKLPLYYSIVGRQMVASAVAFWYDLGFNWLTEEAQSALIFCNSDGSKSLILRLSNPPGVAVSLFRSACPDERYLTVLADAIGKDSQDLREAFQQLPKFNSSEVEKVIGEVSEIATAGPAFNQARALAGKYDSPSTTRINRYKFDIRVFALNHRLRSLIRQVNVQILLLDEEEEEGPAYVRLYLYNTSESIPLRPPILACVATKDIREPFDALKESGEIAAQSESVIAQVLRRESLKFRQGEVNRTFGFLCPGRPALKAIVEVRGPDLENRQIQTIRDAIEAALDPSGELIYQSLRKRSRLTSNAEASEFRKLLLMYGKSITPVFDDEEYRYCDVQAAGKGAWCDAIFSLYDCIRDVPRGALSSQTHAKLESVLSTIKFPGAAFEESVFRARIAELQEHLILDRFGLSLAAS